MWYLLPSAGDRYQHAALQPLAERPQCGPVEHRVYWLAHGWPLAIGVDREGPKPTSS